jgi:hypothetical protein
VDCIQFLKDDIERGVPIPHRGKEFDIHLENIFQFSAYLEGVGEPLLVLLLLLFVEVEIYEGLLQVREVIGK